MLVEKHREMKNNINHATCIWKLLDHKQILHQNIGLRKFGPHPTSRLRRKPYPPGPRGLPIIGNIMMANQLNHHGLAELAKHYGSLFHLKMGSVHVIVVTSPEKAKQVLHVQDTIFSNRFKTIAINYLTYGRVDMVFEHCTLFWRRMRQLSVMRLFSRKQITTWQSICDEVDHIVRVLSGRARSPVNVRENVFLLTKNVIYRAAFGSNLSERQDEFLAILQELSQLFGALNITDFIPFLTWADLNGLNKRLVKARSDLDEFIDPIVDSHKDENTVEKDLDIVDELLNCYNEDGNINELEDSQNSLRATPLVAHLRWASRERKRKSS